MRRRRRRNGFTLNWINNCVGDPEADNLMFKYAGALRDFGELERARNVYSWLQG
jgi:hypothetical protein